MNNLLTFQRIQKKEDYLEVLFSKAFTVVSGRDYNKVSYELREGTKEPPFQFYEVILQENLPWEYLRDKVYPSLVRYLKYKSLDPESGRGLIVSLFFGNQFYLIKYLDFIKVFCEIEGLNEIAFRSHIVKWLSAIDR